MLTLSYEQAMRRLKSALTALGIENAEEYGLHSFRRGSAHDLLLAKTPLRDVLAACDWRSSAFQEYMGREQIDAEALLAAADALSDGD